MRSRFLGLALLGTVALVAGTCDHEPDEHELPDGDLTSMEMAPVDVQVSPATNTTRRFQLFAWYRHDDSIVPGRTDPQEWRLSTTDGNVTGGVVSILKFPLTGATTAQA
jgi:hypothetical protein